MKQAIELKFAQPVNEQVADVIAMSSFPSEEQQLMIATAAYYKAEAHGFAPGYELEDWLAAEAEVGESL